MNPNTSNLFYINHLSSVCTLHPYRRRMGLILYTLILYWSFKFLWLLSKGWILKNKILFKIIMGMVFPFPIVMGGCKPNLDTDSTTQFVCNAMHWHVHVCKSAVREDSPVAVQWRSSTSTKWMYIVLIWTPWNKSDYWFKVLWYLKDSS